MKHFHICVILALLAALSASEPLVFVQDQIVPYGIGQDFIGDAIVSAYGTSVSLTGNSWKAFPVVYQITPRTRLSCEFKASALVEVHGIGLGKIIPSHEEFSAAKNFINLGGTQGYGTNRYRIYDTPNEWMSFDVPIGRLFGQYDLTECVYFAHDDDANADLGNTSEWRNVRIYEEPMAKPYVEQGGIVMMEAEAYSALIVDERHPEMNYFSALDTTASAGGYMTSPCDPAVGMVAYGKAGSRLDYDISFATPGTYQIWIRGRRNLQMPGGQADSHYLVLDDGDLLTVHVPHQYWAWYPSDINLEIVGSGVQHRLSVVVREEGADLDQIMLCATGYDPREAGGAVPLVQSPNGTVMIGTAIDQGDALLQVAGTIKAKSIVVTDIGWADDVFEPGYVVPGLAAVERFIAENGHLPGIPSESELQRSGLDLAGMQALHMRKIEELTLQLIAEYKRNTDQQRQLDELRAIVQVLVKEGK